MKILLVLISISLVNLTACSARNWYEGMHASHEAACLKVPEAEYQNCVKDANTSYNDYDKARQQLKKPAPAAKVVKNPAPTKP